MIAVTGASGFIGRALCAELAASGVPVRPIVRRGAEVRALPTGRVEITDILDVKGLSSAFEGASAVIHLAGRAHRMVEDASDPLAEFRRVNVLGTKAVFEAAAAARVSRVLVASSVKVVGESNSTAWTESTVPRPIDHYGISKLEAERSALDDGKRLGVEAVVMRFPLVYGPGAPANVLRLLRAVDTGLPLPFGWVRNHRSMLYSGNLVSATRTLVDAQGVGGEVFFLADGVDLSTPDLIRTIAQALGRPARLLPAPVAVLRVAGMLTRKTAEVRRLVESLTVSIEKLRQRAGWVAPFTPVEGWSTTAAWFRAAAP